MARLANSPGAGGRDLITFSAFCLDLRAGRLTRAGDAVPLRPKTWAVLVYLAERPGMLVSKEELLDAVWPDVAVTPDTLTKSIGELRSVLGDDSKVPRYIETAHRRGFRFIAETRFHESPPAVSRVDDELRASDREPGTRPFVGREAELRCLKELLRKAHQGERQLVFVTGSPGVGKSALIEAFLESPAVRGAAVATLVGRGACIEPHGAREAYMPVLECLGRLARQHDAEKLTALLRRTAPTWLAQMPWLIGDDTRGVRQAMQAANPDRMLREFAALTEVLAGDTTVILVLEDLHWSDPSTVDLLSVLAQRHETARLLVIGTYRPAELVVQEHSLSPLAHRLKARRRSTELPVHELTTANVRTYLEARFPGAQFPPALAPSLHDHTDGNPLFMVAVVEHMLSRGLILDTAPGWALSVPLERIELGVPDDVGQMAEAQIEMLSPPDRELLEVASVSGIEAAVPAIAGALGSDAGAVEMRCEALARSRRFLNAAGSTEWPDGSVTRRYAFTHEIYRQVVYAGIPDRRRMLLHQRVGEVLEAAYGERAPEIAPALAVHFEKSRDHPRAISYLTAAGARARRRFANREVLAYLEPALASVARLHDPEVRERLELRARIVLGPALADLHGYASELVGENYERADALSARAASPAEQFEIVYALCHFHAANAHHGADAMAKRLGDLAGRVGTAQARLRADSALVRIALVAGRFGEARACMERMVGSNPELRLDRQPDFGPDALIDAYSHYALALWFLGHPEHARAMSRASVEAARASGISFTRAAAACLGGVLELFCGNAAEALALAEEAVSLCSQQGFAYWQAMAWAVRGQAWVLRGQTRAGLDELARARSALDETGTRVFSTHILAFLADAHRQNGSFAEALAAADEGLALAETTLDRTYRAELWRLKGELLLALSSPGLERRERAEASRAAASEPMRQEAERCLLRALDLARESEAKSLEVRAATSLAGAWQEVGREKEAVAALGGVCDWFSSDDGGTDLDRARTLLDELRRSAPVRSDSAGCKRSPARQVISANLRKTFRTRAPHLE